MKRCQGTKRTINHFLQVFGVSYSHWDEKCFENKLHGFREHSCALPPPRTPDGGRRALAPRRDGLDAGMGYLLTP